MSKPSNTEATQLTPREIVAVMHYLKGLEAVTVEFHPALYREDMTVLRALRSRLEARS